MCVVLYRYTQLPAVTHVRTLSTPEADGSAFSHRQCHALFSGFVMMHSYSIMHCALFSGSIFVTQLSRCYTTFIDYITSIYRDYGVVVSAIIYYIMC